MTERRNYCVGINQSEAGASGLLCCHVLEVVSRNYRVQSVVPLKQDKKQTVMRAPIVFAVVNNQNAYSFVI